MKLLLKNISVNYNRDAEAEEDKKDKKLKSSKTLLAFIQWKEKTVGFGLKVH